MTQGDRVFQEGPDRGILHMGVSVGIQSVLGRKTETMVSICGLELVIHPALPVTEKVRFSICSDCAAGKNQCPFR